jgi:hypothetical protein
VPVIFLKLTFVMGKISAPQIFRTLTAKNKARRNSRIKGIVLHDTAGSGTHNDTRYLANPGDGRGVSVDFTVERDGSIWQLNPDLPKYCCFHAGRRTKFKGLLDGAVNHATIGIEIVQKADLALKPLYPEAQVQAVAHLCAWLCGEYGLEKADITTHRQIIRDGSRSDPRQFPFEGISGLWERFHRIKNNFTPPRPCLDHSDSEPDDDEVDTAIENIKLAPVSADSPVNSPAVEHSADHSLPSERPQPAQQAAVLSNTELPAQGPVEQTGQNGEPKKADAPAKEGSVKNATGMTIAGIAVPAFLAAFIRVAQDAITQGFVDARQVGDAAIAVLTQNQRFVWYCILAIIGLMAVKKAFKQVTFLFQMWIKARPDLHDVEIKPQ